MRHRPTRPSPVRPFRPPITRTRLLRSPIPLLVVLLAVPASAVVVGPTAALAVGDGGGAGPRAGTAPVDRTGPEYRPPVEAPVIDPFREPSGPYGPGNRGLEYAATPGAVAGAIGDGVVVFAGQVAGRLVVSLVHPDGLRSSLTGLAEISVGVGAVVAGGDPLGRTGTRLHLGVRRDGRYIDPATLFAGGPPRHAVLVPVAAR